MLVYTVSCHSFLILILNLDSLGNWDIRLTVKTFLSSNNLYIKDVRECVNRSIAKGYLMSILVDYIAVAYIFNSTVISLRPIREDSDVF
jgi:hypothetical protein